MESEVKKMYYKKERGNIGEEIATKYLISQNYIIMDRNFHARNGEIDIIAKEKDTKEIVFIEVKARSNNHYGKPRDAVDQNKVKHIYQTAQYYIYLKKLEKEFMRFDIIEIYFSYIKGKYIVNHIKNIEW